MMLIKRNAWKWEPRWSDEHGVENPWNSAQQKVKGRPLTSNKGLKTLTPKQILQKLLITVSQLKADNTFEIYWIYQLIYYLYQAKEITEKVYNNIMNSIKFIIRMDAIYVISLTCKTL